MCGRMKCLCGCGQEVKEGRRYIHGHHGKGKHHSKEAKRKISEGNKGKIIGKKTRQKLSESHKGIKHTKETKRKMSESRKGSKNSNFKYGKIFILNEHLKHKKQECCFTCESEYFELHHEPKLNYNKILEWEGRLINLCHSCHKRVHDKTLKLPHNVGIKWTLKDTEKVLRGGEYFH